MAQYVYTMNRVGKIVPPKRQILKNISLSFFPGAKIGVLGLNGSGKSSLLKIMAGVDKDIEGEAIPMPGLKVGYLPQEPQLDPEQTVRQAVEEGLGEVFEAKQKLEEIYAAYAEPDADFDQLAADQAKYEAILVPIAERVMLPEHVARVEREDYFDFVLHHELSHGLGPGKLVIDGRETEVRLELRDLYSALEEAKADVLGMYNIYLLIDKGVLPASKGENLSWTVVPGLFRSARFGVTEAHGLGVVCQFNFLAEKGALSISESGKFAPVEERHRTEVRTDRALLQVRCKAQYVGLVL